MPFPFGPGVETATLESRLFCAGGIAGEFRRSSLFTSAAFEGVGESTEPDMLLALSSCSRLGIGVADECEPPKGFLRAAPLMGIELLFELFACGAGDPAGLPLAPNLSVIRDAVSGNLILIFVPAGSGTACFASFNFL